MPVSVTLCVSWESPATYQRAVQISSALGLPLVSQEEIPKANADYVLRVTEEKLLLEWQEEKQTHQLFAEFLKGPLGFRRRRGGGLKQDLCKAIGIKTRSDGLKVLDGTAGLGKDAFILASFGCSVVLLERSPIIFALLQDGWMRAVQDETIGEWVKKNMRLEQGDLRTSLKTYLNDFLNNSSKTLEPAEAFDVIYLDPMFPPRKKSALTKMEMRIIRDIVGKDEDMDFVLTEALELASKRVVVKRPLHAPHLQNITPDFVVSGKTNRYDVYLTLSRRGNNKIHE